MGLLDFLLGTPNHDERKISLTKIDTVFQMMSTLTKIITITTTITL